MLSFVEIAVFKFANTPQQLVFLLSQGHGILLLFPEDAQLRRVEQDKFFIIGIPLEDLENIQRIEEYFSFIEEKVRLDFIDPIHFEETLVLPQEVQFLDLLGDMDDNKDPFVLWDLRGHTWNETVGHTLVDGGGQEAKSPQEPALYETPLLHQGDPRPPVEGGVVDLLVPAHESEV